MGACQPKSDQEENLQFAVSGELPHPPAKKTQQPNNPFFYHDGPAGEKQTLLKNYTFHSHYNDKFIGECNVLEERQTGNLFLSKEEIFDDEHEFNQRYEALKRKKQKLTQENILRIKQIIGKTTDGFLWDRKKLITIIDYPFINLHREIANRTSKKIPFNFQQLANIMISSIRGYKAIQDAGFKVDKVRLKHIFFGIQNRQTIIKVTEGNIFADNNNFENMMKLGVHHQGIKDIYLSPEQFDAWKKKKKDYEPSPKSGVFSLGMSFLDICIMDSSRQAYHFTEKTMDEAQIKNRIEISGKKYGGLVEKFLTEMLKMEKDKRPSFTELHNQILSLKKPEESKMHLSVIPTQTSGYINNDTRNLQSSLMFKSVISQQYSRYFASRMKVQKKEEEVENIVEYYTNGNKYFGQKKGGVKHGKGKYEFKDGSYYDGQWENNKICGTGELYFPNHKLEYVGEWYNDEFNGWGTQYAQEEEKWDKYEGEFQNGVREGRGKMTFKDGTIYEGEFRGGKISGRGRKISSGGQITEEYWQTVSPAFFLAEQRR